MKPTRRILLALGGLLLITGLGIFGYVTIEGWSWIDALYMTVITLSTVGYKEVAPLSPEGRMFTVALILLGVGTALYLLSVLAEDIGRAQAVVIATPSESDNVFITLSARELNPEVRIHARAESETAIRRLERAGANQVTSPFQMGGIRTAASILRPSVVEFLEISSPRHGQEIDLEEIRVDPASPLSGRDRRDLEAEIARLRVVAIKRREGPIQMVPPEGAKIEAGDHLVVIGERESLGRLAQLAQNRAR